jgi:hypothetical protein
MNTDKHGLKKIFCCFNKNRIYDGRGISVHQCPSVANSGVLGWVLKTKKINSVLSVVKYLGDGRGRLCVFLIYFLIFDI